MEFGFSKQNIKNIVWHLMVVAGSAVALEVLNNFSSLNLDPKTLAILAIVSPTIKTIIEGLRKA